MYIRHVEESKHLNTLTNPMIIISASGMAEGGRILHHLKAFLPNEKNAVLFTWLKQSEGSPKMTFVTHGEPESANTLKTAVESKLQWKAKVPTYQESVEL